MDFIRTLAIESWTLYSIGMLLVVARLTSRRLKLGSWKLQIDDWLMVFAFVNFTGVVVSVNEVAKNGSNYMTPEVAAALTPEQVEMAIYGSKMTLALELFTLGCIWTIKACLLILYYRLASAFRKQRLIILFTTGFCVVAFVLIISLFLGFWCAPIYEYWAVPVRISQCATYYNHMIFATAWNISSDLMLLTIPIPVVFKTQLPLKRKLVLCCVLGLGVLNIIVAVLNRYYNFNNPESLGYVYFYVAEVATAVYVGNVPLCWPIFQRIFQGSSWTNSTSKPSKPRDGNYPRTANAASRLSRKTQQGPAWGASRGDTAWDKMDDVEEQSQSKEGSYQGVADDQTSTIELTTQWRQPDGIVTEVQADRVPSSDGGGNPAGSRGQVTVVKTVQISRDVDRSFLHA